MELLRKKAYARAGLIGNPSDGYHGKTISIMVLPPGNDFWTSYTGRKWFFLDQEPLEIEISSY